MSCYAVLTRAKKSSNNANMRVGGGAFRYYDRRSGETSEIFLYKFRREVDKCANLRRFSKQRV